MSLGEWWQTVRGAAVTGVLRRRRGYHGSCDFMPQGLEGRVLLSATQLAIVQQPSTGQTGTAPGTVIIDVEDASKNVVTTDTSTVTLTLSGGTFSTGSATASKAAVKGVATFSNLVINAPGTYTLTATDGTLASAVSSTFAAEAYDTVASFAPAATGAGPTGNVALDTNGDLFGTTFSGGANNDGTLFEIAAGASTITTLASFTGGGSGVPNGVTIDSSGNLFGSCAGINGIGSLFELVHGASTITTLASFNAAVGEDPGGNVAIDSAGDLFGTTNFGATGSGTLFELAHGASTISLLVAFNGTNGKNPDGNVVLDSAGNVYGTTYAGGANGNGVVFKWVKGVSGVTDLASFNGANGSHPDANLVFDSNGNLFGAAGSGGSAGDGDIFEIAAGTSAIIDVANFKHSNGEWPDGGPIIDSNGDLFGTTYYGGSKNDGTVFEIAAGSSSITTLASFNGANGAHSQTTLALDANGNLFGTTREGGAYNVGTAWEVAKGASAITVLSNFAGSVGNSPVDGIVFDSSGDIFGSANNGGPSNKGMLFEIAAGSTFITALASFNGTNGWGPNGVAIDSSGDLFGTTNLGGQNSKGVIFELVAGAASINVLASFSAATEAFPTAGVILDSSGNLYGTTSGGSTGHGTVFELAKGSSSITTLATFNGSNGDQPNAPLTFDSSGNLYGTSFDGGAHGDGTVFEVVKGSGTITDLASFNGTNGNQSYSNVTIDSSGNLYGTAFQGGSKSDGAVWELAHGTTTLATLVNFTGSNGNTPYAGLVIDSAGDLFGTTGFGGPHGDGEVFEIVHGATSVTLLAGFTNGNNSSNSGVVFDAAGNLFGETFTGGVSRAGSVYEITTAPLGLTFVAPPADASAGNPLADAPGVQVGVNYPWSNPDATDTSAITLTLDSGVFENGLPTITANAVNGIATFPGLAVETAGVHTITATDGNFVSVTSAPFTITPAAPNPAQAVVSVGSPAIDVHQTTTLTLNAGTDAFGNLETGLGVVFYLGAPGTSGGTIGQVRDNHDGTYSATFTADSSGTARTISVLVNGSPIAASASVTVDPLPAALSIDRANPAGPNTTASSVSYTVSFSEAVSGVDASDFTVLLTGNVTYSTLDVTPIDGADYTVTIDGIQGAGTLGLNLLDDGSIRDSNGGGLQNTPGAAVAFQLSGTFAASATERVLTADFNNDGIPDLLTVPVEGSSSQLWLGNGNGTFQSPIILPIATGYVTVADVNNDGNADLLFTDFTSSAEVMLGNGNGTFQAMQSIAIGGNSLAAADLNGDGKMDLIGGFSFSGVAIALGNGDGTFAPQQTYNLAAEGAIAADVNGDGKIDLVSDSVTTNRVSVSLGNGDGTFQSPMTFAVGNFPEGIAVADLNHDGHPDIVVANTNGNSVSVLLGNGDGTFEPQQTLAGLLGPTDVASTDLNGDGIPDLLVVNSQQNGVSEFLGKGDGTFQPQTTIAGLGGQSFMAVADLDQDGRPDLVTSGSGAGTFLNTANGNLTGPAYNISPDSVSATVTAPGSAVPGAPVTFTIIVSNDGANEADGISVKDLAPAVFVPKTIFYGAVDNGLGASGFTLNGAGNINDTVNLPAGAVITYSLTGTIDPAATGVLSDLATVATTNGVVNTEANVAGSTAVNQSTGSTTLTPQANFSVAITGSNPLTVGGIDVYTIVVTNDGPSNMTGINVADSFPFLSGVTYSSTILSAPGTVSGNTSSATPADDFTLDDTLSMAAGAMVQYRVIGTLVPGVSGSVTDSVSVAPTAGAGAGISPSVSGSSQASVSSAIVPGPAGSVVARSIFYGNSGFDGGNLNAATNPTTADFNAIAPDKVPLMPGQTASFENYTSYTGGINGLFIDLFGDVPASLSAADFEFAVGNTNTPGSWTTLATAPVVTAFPGQGIAGSDRIALTWPAGTIQKQWLQVTVLGDSNTGLPADDPDLFCFGNAIGEAGNSTSDTYVNANDQLAVRGDPHTFLNPALISNPHDYNRDGLVNAADELAARGNGTNFFNALQLISMPAMTSAAVQSMQIAAPSSKKLTTGTTMLLPPVNNFDLLPSGSTPPASLDNNGEGSNGLDSIAHALLERSGPLLA